MKITELAPIHVGQEVRVMEPGHLREALGRLESVSFEWEDDPDSWAGGLKVRVARLQISDWKIEVGPDATVDVVSAATHPAGDACGLAGGGEDAG